MTERILNEIILELEKIENLAEDRYIKAAAQANLIKYKKELEDLKRQNALDVIEYKIAHLTRRLNNE